jgi:hypothetical protein
MFTAAPAASWAKTLPSSSVSTNALASVTDPAGNIYVVGSVGAGTVGFGNNVAITSASTDIGGNGYIAKFNSSGVAQWANTVTSSGGATGHVGFQAIAIDSTGNLYAAGQSSEIGAPFGSTFTYNFGNSVTASGTSFSGNPFLVKYNSAGVAQWAKTLTSGNGISQIYYTSVAVDSNTNIYVSGAINDNSTYGFGNSVTAAGSCNTSGNAVLVKYNSSGTAQWAQTTSTGSQGSVFASIGIDGSNNIYAAGTIYGTDAYSFGNSVTAAGQISGFSQNPVLVKYNSSGTAQWAATVTAAQAISSFSGVVVDSSGNAYVSGLIQGSSQFSFGNGVSATGSITSGSSPLLMKYNTSGIAQWADTTISGTDGASFGSLALDGNGNIYVVGFLAESDVYSFGNGVFASGSATGVSPGLFGSPYLNPILIKYNSSGAAQWTETTSSGSVSSSFSSVSVDASGNIFVGGYVNGTTAFGFNNGITATGTDSGSNFVLLKY